MPAYVRKQPLAERVKSALNIYDLLLWLSEEIESNGWDQLEKEWAIPIGFAFNFIFLIARANIGAQSASYDDIFTEPSGTGWTAAIVSLLCVMALIKTNLCAGMVLHTFLDASLPAEYLLHLLSKATLPPLRSIRRHGTTNTFGAPSQAQFFPCIIISSPVSVECAWK